MAATPLPPKSDRPAPRWACGSADSQSRRGERGVRAASQRAGPLRVPRASECLSGSQGMALLRQSVRDASTQVLPSPAGHPGDAQNARPGRRKGPRASGLARRRLPGHAFPRSALTRQPADGAHNAHPPPRPPSRTCTGPAAPWQPPKAAGRKISGLGTATVTFPKQRGLTWLSRRAGTTPFCSR